MEHYLGEKLKSLRESRNWTQADLAKRLNKAVSTISGYESDAHAIPLDVLASISLLFGISTDELLDLETSESLSLSGLAPAQQAILEDLRREFLAPSQRGKDFSPQQMKILHDIIKAFSWLKDIESVSVTSSMSFLLPFHDRKTVFHYHNMDFLIVFE